LSSHGLLAQRIDESPGIWRLVEDLGRIDPAQYLKRVTSLAILAFCASVRRLPQSPEHRFLRDSFDLLLAGPSLAVAAGAEIVGGS